MPGQVSGYRLLTEYSSDQLLAVCHAVRESDGSDVVVHVVVGQLNRTQLRRVRDEASALDNMLAVSNNPFVLPLIDHGKDSSGRPFLVTPVRGQSLAAELAERGPLPAADARSVVLEAATGLELLHRNEMPHRRISPAALLRQPTGRVVLDCPMLPTLAEEAARLTEGTGHEPPEVLQGQDWTPRGEVYALASTLWTLFSGRPVFRGKQAERLLAMLTGKQPDLRHPDAPDQLLAALRRALASDPGARPESVLAFAQSLQQDAQPVGETLPPANDPRQLGNDYELLSPIGAGSSGTVWRARRISDGKLFAAKVIHPALVADPDTLMRLVREGAAQDLVHPHLVRVHDTVIARGRGEAAVIMELVDGSDMRKLMTGHELGRAEGARLLSEVAAGLAEVHARGFVHRDLKPENILVRELDGRRTALLTDFGLVRAIDQPTVTRSGQVPGTPAYLAPELIDAVPPSRASDVYALGVTAYEVLAGYRPFSGASNEEVLRQHRENHPARPADLPDQAWQFLSACLAKDPAARPSAAVASETLGDLARVIVLTGPEQRDQDHTVPALRAVSTPPPAAVTDVISTPHEPAKPTVRRWRALAGSVVAVAVIGTAIGIWLGTRSEDPPGETPKPVARYQVAAAAKAEDGKVVVTWPAEQANLPGLHKFLVFRDNTYVGEVPKQTSTYVDLAAPDSGCYHVIAVGTTAAAPDPPPPPACPRR